MKYVGIDPGANGGIAIIESINGEIVGVELFKFPKKDEELADLLAKAIPVVDYACWLEHVHAMPNQGVVSTFTFGKNFGVVCGILIANNVNFSFVRPQYWQKILAIDPRRKGVSRGSDGFLRIDNETKSEWKDRLKKTAKRMYPELRITLNTADALLIAEACRRTGGIVKHGKTKKKGNRVGRKVRSHASEGDSLHKSGLRKKRKKAS